MPNQYDIAVLGGGLSGLSFVYQLLQSDLKNYKVILIQEEPKTKNDRTWCYWGKEQLFPGIPHNHVWDKLKVSNQTTTIHAKLKKLKYFELNSLAFYRHLYALIEAHPSISLSYQRVEKVFSKGEIQVVKTSQVEFQARYVVNSIPNLFQPLPLIGKLNQNFYGQRIKVNAPIFNQYEATLMEFEQAKTNEVGFFYVLPYSSTEGLIEYTRISKDVKPSNHYKKKIKDYLLNYSEISSFQVLEEEKGVIPMTTFDFDRNPMANVYQVGTVGGDTKATTGYTLASVQESCKSILFSIKTGGKIKSTPSRYKFYDTLMLHLMEHKPHLIPKVLVSLFQHNSGDTVLNFLNEKTNLPQEAKIFTTLEWEPFINALVKNYFVKNEIDLQTNSGTLVSSNL